MNRAQFAEILKNPESVSEETLSGIKEIIEEYPFFQLGRMLWIKNLHKLDHIKYNSELKTSAAYIPDRTKLFQLINNISKPSNNNLVSNIKEEEIEDNTTAEAFETETPVKEKKSETKEPTPSITITDNYLNASDELKDEKGNLYNFTPKEILKKEEEETEIQNIVLPAADLLDYEMTTSSGYSLPDIEEVEDINDNTTKSFSDWLHVMHYSAPPKQEEKSKPTKKGMDLIDSFLNSKPQIVPNPRKKVNEIDLSIDSTSNPDELLSETLADMHIKQGNKSKAILILEKLHLKYPEKSVYFARRIKEIKEN